MPDYNYLYWVAFLPYISRVDKINQSKIIYNDFGKQTKYIINSYQNAIKKRKEKFELLEFSV